MILAPLNFYVLYNTIQFKRGLHRGEMSALVSLASMKRQAELEQEGEQEPVDDKLNVSS